MILIVCISGHVQDHPQAQRKKPSLYGRVHTKQSPYEHIHMTTSGKPCPKCSQRHHISICPAFKEMPVQERLCFINNEKICKQCLSHKYISGKKCRNKSKCYKCPGAHHTLLHDERDFSRKDQSHQQNHDQDEWEAPVVEVHTARHSIQKNVKTSSKAFNGQLRLSPGSPAPQAEVSINRSRNIDWNNPMFHAYGATTRRSTVLLPTALVKVVSKKFPSQVTSLRILVDQGSTITMITREAVQLMKLQQFASPIDVSGIGDAAGESKSIVHLTLESQLHTGFKLPIAGASHSS